MNFGNEMSHKATNLDARAAKVIDEAAELVFKAENIVSFCKVTAENYLLDYRNQLLIWRQRENAGTVVSKKALEKLGYTVPDTVKPVTVLYPVVVCVNEGKLRTERDGTPVRKEGKFVYDRAPEFQLKYQPVPAYDLTDAEVAKSGILRMEKDIDIWNTVRGNVDFVVETDGENSFPGKGVVDYVNGRFLLKPGLSDRERDLTMLELFADYYTETKLRKDRFFTEKLSEKGFFLLSFLLRAAVLARFGMLTVEFSLMPLSEAEQMDTGTKEDLLMCLNLGLQSVMETLLGKYLSFDETALCNSLLRQNRDGKVVTELIAAPFSFRRADGYIDQVMIRLSEGLTRSGEEELTKMCAEVRNQNLTVYPPYPFP